MIINFAHRGSLTEAPENTLPSFKKAIHNGAKAIELDVQLSKDNQLIICHDHHFRRLNHKIKGFVNDYSLEEIKKMDIGSSFSNDYTGTTIPTLEEFIEICPQDITLNIEIKNIPIIHDNIENILIECLTKHNRFDNLIISSFDHLALNKIHKIAPNIDLGMLFHYRILKTWNYVESSGLEISSIHPNEVFVDRNFVEECKNLGYKVYPYTVNQYDRYKELLNYGVDGVFSDNPEIYTI